MDDNALFLARHAEVDELVTAHQIDGPQGALALAEKLTQDFPERVDAWFIYALCAEALGLIGLATTARTSAMACPDCDILKRGDLLRDQLMGEIRRMTPPGHVDMTTRYGELLRLHGSDPNRIACLHMLFGRYHYLTGVYGVAVYWHVEASRHLQNPQWMFNNLLHWMKALKMEGNTTLQYLYAQLAQECPPRNPEPGKKYRGTRSILWRARLVRFAPWGSQIDDWLQRYYWRVVIPRRSRKR